MNQLLSALQSKDLVTENGMPTHSTSGDYCLDLFFKAGGWRNSPDSEIIQGFTNALKENPLLALKLLFYVRDIPRGDHGGLGERKIFRTMFKWLCVNYPETAIKNLDFVPEVGRFDDLYEAFDTPVEMAMVECVLNLLKTGNKLYYKWLPREGKANDKYAKRFINYFGMTPREYRLLLSQNTEVVENLMCKNLWSEINYNHVPSKAIHNYRKAFGKHDQDRYAAWLESLKKPESGNKVNATAIFPNEVIKPYLQGYYNFVKVDENIEQQWKALKDYVKDGSFITVNDVSGSMSGEPMEVSIALGIYLAERNKGPFKDAFITFSGTPKLQVLKGKTLLDKVKELSRAEWEGNTDIEAVFKLILDNAIKYNVPQDEMPNSIIIISDMQFDACVKHSDNTALEMIKRRYTKAGYKIPNVIFWNVRTSSGVPVKLNESGVALVSGYSPAIMLSVLGGEISPMRMMLKALGSRYDGVEI